MTWQQGAKYLYADFIIAPKKRREEGAMRIRVGREGDNDFVVPSHHAGVGRHHAEIMVDEMGRMTIWDVGSRNGTWVDGRRADRPTSFTVHSTVILGHQYHLDMGEIQKRLQHSRNVPAARAQPHAMGSGGASQVVARVNPHKTVNKQNIKYIRCECGHVRPEGSVCPECGKVTKIW